jgi:hypothetical protein
MRKLILPIAVASVLAAPVMAADFGLFGAYQDTDARDDTFGGGLNVGFGLNDALDLTLGAAYLEKLNDEPLDGVFDDDERVFAPGDLQIAPLEAGLRFNFGQGERMRPYVSAGASYFLLDSNRRGVDVPDEFGWFASLGSNFGDGDGLDVFVEGIYRNVEATVEIDPDEIEDVDDIEGLNEEVAVDLDGLGMNAGLRWRW